MAGRTPPRKALTTRPPSPRYEVGYGKPPVETRFKPGVSGNPSGRPKGARKKRPTPALNEERLKSIILEEAYRSIKINDSDRQVSIPMAQAVIRSFAVNAARGNQRAQRLFTELLSATERDNHQLHQEWLETAINYKVEWERELDRRNRFGITDLPEPLPHPDHVVIDMKTGTVRITGPMTNEEKSYWEQLRARKKESDEEIAELERILREEPDYPHRDMVLEELEHERKILRDHLHGHRRLKRATSVTPNLVSTGWGACRAALVRRRSENDREVEPARQIEECKGAMLERAP